MTQVAILGTGSLGSIIALHCQDLAPFALPRDKQSTTVLQIETPLQRWRLQLPCWQGSTIDWLVVCTKAQATLAALQSWQQHLPQVAHILLLQNGMGQQQQVANWLKDQDLPCTLWAGMSTEGAYQQQDKVVYAGAGKNLIGLWPQGNSTQTLLPQTQFSPNIEHHLRNKLAINAVINPLTAKLKCLNGELVSNPSFNLLLQQLCQEVAGLYQALEWPLEPPLLQYAEQVAQATAQNRSSTLQDILAQRETELPYINGFLLEQANKIGYSMPLLTELLLALSH